MTILASVKIGKDFRITIPKEVREYLNLIEGEELIFFTKLGEKGRVCFRSG